MRQTPRRKKHRRQRQPTLRFSPYAWAKLLFLRDRGPTEIGGFGITLSSDLLFVEDLVLVRQTCSPMTVEFDDAAVADLFDAQVDRGLKPEQFGRIWVHTHPGYSAVPSGTDEQTFDRVFGPCQWAVMFILARGGETSARLRINVGPGCSVPLPVEVAFECPFPASNEVGWQVEFDDCVRMADSLDRWRRESLSDVLDRLPFDGLFVDGLGEQPLGIDQPSEEVPL